MNPSEKAEKEIFDILRQNPEEFNHAENTVDWLLKIKPDSDFILKISALSHDIERVIYGKDEKKYPSHREFKLVHCKRSSDIVKEILLKNNFDKEEIKRAEDIICNHEFGGNKEANLIKDTDSLANFQWCDEMFGKIGLDSLKETMKRMVERMEKENKIFLGQVKFKNKEIDSIFKEIRTNLQEPD